MDDETRQQFQALTALIVGVKESLDGRIGSLDGRIGSLEGRIGSLDGRIGSLEGRIESQDRKIEALSMQIVGVQQSLDRKTEALSTLIESVKESLEREVGNVRDTVQRMDARLGKIAAGAHYVTRLVEWSEKQDAFQLDILHRVQALEARQDKKQG